MLVQSDMFPVSPGVWRVPLETSVGFRGLHWTLEPFKSATAKSRRFQRVPGNLSGAQRGFHGTLEPPQIRPWKHLIKICLYISYVCYKLVKITEKVHVLSLIWPKKVSPEQRKDLLYSFNHRKYCPLVNQIKSIKK